MVSTLAETRVHVDPDELAEFCRRNHIKRLLLYGSILRDDFRPDSDIDVMVEFDEGRTPGLFGFGSMAVELEEMFGREVDLKTPGFFPSSKVDGVLATAEVLFAAK